MFNSIWIIRIHFSVNEIITFSLLDPFICVLQGDSVVPMMNC